MAGPFCGTLSDQWGMVARIHYAIAINCGILVQLVSHIHAAGGSGCHAGEKHWSSLLRTRSIRRAAEECKHKPGQKSGQLKQIARHRRLVRSSKRPPWVGNISSVTIAGSNRVFDLSG